MTIKEALQNINVVVANARMTRQEHDSLSQSLALVTARCQKADALEKEKEVK